AHTSALAGGFASAGVCASALAVAIDATTAVNIMSVVIERGGRRRAMVAHRSGHENGHPGSGVAVPKKRALWQREHEYAVAALRVDLVVAAGRDRDVLLAVDHVGYAR